MKKIFASITFSFLLFSFVSTINASNCDWFDPDFESNPCGNWAGCKETQNQAGCVADCSDPVEYGGWAFPKCECGEEESICWCECVDECAREYCISHGYAGGECKNDKSSEPNCYYGAEEVCNDNADNDNDGSKDCKDADCEGKICGDDKVCIDGNCIKELPTCVGDCQWVSIDCWCGDEKTEIKAGDEFCCSTLSKKYTLKSECEEECDAAKAEGGNGNGEDEEDGGWIFTCPGEETVCPEGAFCIENPLCATSFEDLINAIVRFITRLAIAIAPIMFIWAGVLFVTAAGDPAKIQKARDVVLWTIIGLGIVLMSYAIIKVIQEIFGG